MALDSETGAVNLTSEFKNVTENTVLELTAVAEDHGRPPHSSTGESDGSRSRNDAMKTCSDTLFHFVLN